MNNASDRVTEEALSLPVDARLGLVEKLLTSLNLPTGQEVERLWAEEAERRVAQIDACAAKLVPGDQRFRGPPATGPAGTEVRGRRGGDSRGHD